MHSRLQVGFVFLMKYRVLFVVAVVDKTCVLDDIQGSVVCCRQSRHVFLMKYRVLLVVVVVDQDVWVFSFQGPNASGRGHVVRPGGEAPQTQNSQMRKSQRCVYVCPTRWMLLFALLACCGAFALAVLPGSGQWPLQYVLRNTKTTCAGLLHTFWCRRRLLRTTAVPQKASCCDKLPVLAESPAPNQLRVMRTHSHVQPGKSSELASAQHCSQYASTPSRAGG